MTVLLFAIMAAAKPTPQIAHDIDVNSNYFNGFGTGYEGYEGNYGEYGSIDYNVGKSLPDFLSRIEYMYLVEMLYCCQLIGVFCRFSR